MLLSIVMPVFNERDTLLDILERVVNAPVPIEREIILIDDYSTDGTRELYPTLAEKFPTARLKIVEHAQNQGKGAALRTGFQHTAGDYVLIQDADLEYDPADYPALLAPIIANEADVVYGSRFAREENHEQFRRGQYFGNRVLTRFSNLLTGLKLTDMETCYKVMPGDFIRGVRIRSERFGVEPEMTAKIARRRLRVVEVPIHYAGRTYDQGKKITWWDGVKALMTIVRFAIAD